MPDPTELDPVNTPDADADVEAVITEEVEAPEKKPDGGDASLTADAEVSLQEENEMPEEQMPEKQTPKMVKITVKEDCEIYHKYKYYKAGQSCEMTEAQAKLHGERVTIG